MKIAIYYRVSSKGQKDRGTIENQKFKCLPYCADKGFEVVAEFSDPAVSGNTTIESRPDGKKLVDLIKSKEIGGVVTVHVDRLTRSDDAKERGHIWDLLATNNVHLYQVDGFDYTHQSTLEEMIFLNEAFFAKWLRLNLIQKQQVGRDRAVVENRYAAGGQPYGVRWLYDKDHPNRGEWAEVEEEVVTIKKSMELVHQGHSLYYIVDYLNANGYQPKYKQRNGKKTRWSHGSLWATLVKTDFLYTGIRDGDGLDTGIKLFSQEEVQEVRQLITLNKRGSASKGQKDDLEVHFLLKRLLRCSCGWFLSSVTIDGRRRYYRCKKCSYGLRADQTDAKIWAEFYKVYSDPEKMKAAVRGGHYATTSEKLMAAKEQLSRAESTLAKIVERKALITEQLGDVEIGLDPKALRNILTALKDEENKAEADKAEAEQTLADPEIIDEAVEKACSALAKQLGSLHKLSSLIEGHEGEKYLPVEVSERLEGLDTFHIARRTRKANVSFAEVAASVREQRRSILRNEIARGHGIFATKEGAKIIGAIEVNHSLDSPASGQATFG